ncbi:MAG: tetratricopeptide repeat protein [bacterium]
MSIRKALLGVGGFVILSLVGCHHLNKIGPAPHLPQGNIILITIDTLRADHLGCYGNSTMKSPHLDAIAREGVIFPHAYTPVPVTLPSHTSIFTGLYPFYHGVRNNGTFKADDKLETLTEVLRQHGFDTAAFIGSFVLDSRYGLNQGFDSYDDHMKKDPNQAFMVYNERTAGEVVQSAITWLREHGRQRFFLWLHCFDPHAPYEPPEPFSTMYRKNLYDGEIAYVDHALGDLFSSLKEQNMFDETLLVITSDHGEGLGEHAEKTHAIFVYDSTLHVPLIMRYPQEISGGSVVEMNVSTIDIMPTILDIFNIRHTLQFHGKSLLGLIHGSREFSRQELVCETFYTLYNHNWSPLEGLRTAKWKYIKAPRSELYDLEHDPKEMVNLFHQEKETARQLEGRMRELQRAAGSPWSDASAQLKMDKDTQDRLKSLGYVWMAPVPSTRRSDFLPDPKDMISTLDYLNMGTYYYTRGDYRKAVEQFKLMLQINPDDVFTHFVLGYLYDKQDLADLAIQELQEAIRLDPTYVNAYNNLGTLYNRLGKIHEALEVLKIALQLNPDYIEIHDNLGVIYFTLKEYDKAIEEFKKAAELDPQRYEAYSNLGSVSMAIGKDLEAEQVILKALEINPSFLEALNNLGSLYIKKGDYAQAVQKFQELTTYDAEYLQGWINLAMVYVRLDEYDRARQALEKAMHLNPDSPDIYSCLGTISMKEKRFEAAIEQFQKSKYLDPNASETYYNLGIAHYSLSQVDQAINEYKHCLALNPANVSAHVNLGIAYFHQGLYDQSQNHYQRALLLDPNYLEAHINLGVIYYNRGAYDRALAEYRSAKEIDPESVQPYVNMGLTYLAKGLIQEAITEYQGALERSPSNLEAHINLASVFFSQGEYDLALREYLEIVRINPQSPIGYYGLGYSYFYEGLFDQAITALQNALRLKPDYLEARLLLDKVLSVRRN